MSRRVPTPSLLLDQSGWHGSAELVVPPNITLMPLPPRCPELNPVENVWQFMRDNWLSNRMSRSVRAQFPSTDCRQAAGCRQVSRSVRRKIWLFGKGARASLSRNCARRLPRSGWSSPPPGFTLLRAPAYDAQKSQTVGLSKAPSSS